ncbi:FAD dependent oxidoreductase [Aspergillus venezuelensis]
MTKFEPEVDNLEQRLLELIQQDPGLPRDNPTASYWQHIAHKLSNVKSASFTPTTDIAIIGSGITGASVAKTLLEQHETYRMAVGAETAGKIIKFNIKTLEAMRDIARRFAHAQDPELTDVVKLRAFKDEESFAAVCKGIEELERDHSSLTGVYAIIDADSCGKKHGVFEAVGGVLHSSGTVWPYHVVTNLLDALMSQYASRLAIETNTPVTKVDYEPSTDTQYPYILHSARGSSRAAQVVYCTNGYTGHLLPNLRGTLYPMKGTMTVQDWSASPHHQDRGSKASWAIHYLPHINLENGAFADGLIYGIQNTRTGWYFFGGEKSSVEDLLSANHTIISTTPVRFLEESVSSLLDLTGGKQDSGSKLVSSWSGIMGFSSDGLPLVGRLPRTLTDRDSTGEWLYGAYNGYGMPSAWLAGVSLGLMIVGKSPREYLPEAFLISEERLRDRLSAEQSMLHLADP